MANAKATPATAIETGIGETDSTTTPTPTPTPSGDVKGYDSESPTYAAVMETLGDFRACVTPLALVHTKLAAIAKVQPDLPLAIAGKGLVTLGEVTEDTELCEAGEAGYMVSAIGARGIVGADGKKRNGIRALAVYPAHGVDAIIAHNGGAAYLLGLVEKEQGHVAFRGLRGDLESATLADMAAAAEAMPVTLEDFIDRAAQGTGSPFAVFNDNWAAFIAKSREKGIISLQLKKMLPNKREALNCIRSASYASTHYAALEEAEGGSMFVKLGTALAHVIAGVQAKALESGQDAPMQGDPEAIKTWIANRDTLDLEVTEVSGDALAIDMSAFGL
jgi:hypothetical protein